MAFFFARGAFYYSRIAIAGPVVACTIPAGVMGFVAVLCEVIPALAFQASDGFPSVFVDSAIFVTNEEAICDGSVG